MRVDAPRASLAEIWRFTPTSIGARPSVERISKGDVTFGERRRLSRRRLSVRGIRSHPRVASMEASTCSRCAGAGSIAASEGFSACEACRGTGKRAGDACGASCGHEHEASHGDRATRRLTASSTARALLTLPVKDANDGAVNLDATKPLMIAYFSRDGCGACKLFAPTLERFRAANADVVDVVAIACDGENAYEDLREDNFYRCADASETFDRSRTLNPILRALGVNVLPTVCVVHRERMEVLTTWGRTVLTLNPGGARQRWLNGDSGVNPFAESFRGAQRMLSACAYAGT